MKYRFLFILTVCLLSISAIYQVNAQCCSAGAGFSSLPPSLKSSAMEKGDLFVAGLNTTYTYFKEYYEKDKSVKNGLTQEQKTIINTLTLIKSFYTDFLIQADISYIPYFYQDNVHYEVNRSSISDMKLNFGYSFYRDYDNSLFSQFTLGTKIPLEKDSSKVISFQRAYSLNLMSSTMKKFDEWEAFLSLVLRYEKFLSETDNKQPGDNYYAALMFTKVISDFTLSADLNFLLSGREIIEDEVWNGSGYRLLQLSPQVSYMFGNFIAGFRYDLPLYKYYKKFQITPSYSISFNLNYIF